MRAKVVALAAAGLALRARRQARSATGVDEAQRSEVAAKRAEQRAAGAETEAKAASARTESSELSSYASRKQAQLAQESAQAAAERAAAAEQASAQAAADARAAQHSAGLATKVADVSMKIARLAQRAAETAEGPIGPMPQHEWNEKRTRVRFEQAPGMWGEWSADLSGQPGQSYVQYASGGGLTQTEVLALIEANSMADLTEAEYLDDQTSTGAVLTFTFSAAVRKVWVELKSTAITDVAEARVRTDGGTPDSDTGAIIHAGSAMPFLGNTTTVKVLADNGKVVGVYGYR